MCAHHMLQRPGLKVCKALEKTRENSKLTWILFKKIQIQMCQTNTNLMPALPTTKVYHKIHFLVHRILLQENDLSAHE